MILKPQSRSELARQLAGAPSKITSVQLDAFASILEYTPEDMTAQVEAGMRLPALQKELQQHGQWLPIDPPGSESLAIADLLAYDLAGSRRLGYGSIRDYLIGITVLLADGQVIKAGGKVVKNVAGYDLCKLFVGARHSLGVILDATFKLRPLPESEQLVQRRCASMADLAAAGRALLDSPVNPVMLDAHNQNGELHLVAGFAGTQEDVAYQLEVARDQGMSKPGTDAYLRDFWTAGEVVHKLSVLPTKTFPELERLQPSEFVAHPGNGIIHYRGGPPPPTAELPVQLINRVKSTYDPRRILPEYQP